MKAIRMIFAALCLLLFAQCRKAEQPSYLVSAEAKTINDVSYGTDGKQVMDVYLPPNRTTNTNVVILVHGGSFIGGDKSELTKQAQYLAGRGYAVLNVNYPLVDGEGIFGDPPLHINSKVKVKDQVEDIAKIVDFAIANSRKWVMSDKNIGIAGHSAGATLALLYAYSEKNTKKVKAVANLAGALDMVFTDIPGWEQLPPYVFEGAYRYTGKEVAEANLTDYKAISPLYAANAEKKIPTLTILPENNDVMGLPKMDIGTYQRFVVTLNELKVPNEFIFMANANHYFSTGKDWEVVLNHTVDYFNKIFK